MSAPQVSVIVCAYNYERYVAQALDSALAQDHPSFEVVVVDDGSTDGTPQVLERYADRVRLIRRPNGGLNAATATGIAAARGAYLTFLDADDYWPADRLRLLADGLDAHPDAGLVWGDMAVVGTDGEILSPSVRRGGNVEVWRGRVLGRLLERNFISAGALMVRASLRDLFHPIPEHAAYQDWWIASRVATVADVEPVAGIVNFYRMHGANMNLQAEGARALKLLEEELPFRRWLLTATDFALVTPQELAAGLAEHDRLAQALLALDADRARTLLGPDRAAALAAMHAASDALDAADPRTAHGWLVRAAVHDVTDDSPRELLGELTPLLTSVAAAA